jgi:2-polyprenyl-6-hydroxyphenyl methylase / 3-demethylubiquinone-9 3-methyltransferase
MARRTARHLTRGLPPPTWQTMAAVTNTLDPAELARFAALADEWWNPNGKFKPLHRLGPERIAFIRDATLAQFNRPAGGLRPLAGLRALDVGCGGGLVAEPLARLGALVTGIEPEDANISAARSHAASQELTIDYRAARAEDLAASGETFDLVTCLEVIEHVPDVRAFLKVVAALVRPGGLLIVSTLNRTLKSYALAIIGAEYVLRWLPAGTHQWDRFVSPAELTEHVSVLGLGAPRFEGLIYNPLSDRWSRDARDLDVNYLCAAAKPTDAGQPNAGKPNVGQPQGAA